LCLTAARHCPRHPVAARGSRAHGHCVGFMKSFAVVRDCIAQGEEETGEGEEKSEGEVKPEPEESEAKNLKLETEGQE